MTRKFYIDREIEEIDREIEEIDREIEENYDVEN